MFSTGQGQKPIDRRRLLQLGGLSLLGLNIGELSRLRALATAKSPASGHRRNSCVFIFLFGGPSHIDLWDMKPLAPLEVRGEFRPRSSRVPGISLCEHLPHLAGQMDKFVLLRSMTHHMPVHGPACSEMYTGREYFGPPVTDQARREDWPSISSLVMRYGKSAGGLPASVVLPWYTQFVGQSKRIAGQTGGRMGENFNPVLISGDPSRIDFEIPGFRLLSQVDSERISRRRRLLQHLKNNTQDSSLNGSTVAQSLARHTEMAYSMLQKPAFSRALDLQSEPLKNREAFGMTKFGQSLLMARRMVEAGISLVTVNWDDATKADKVSPHWDTHHNNFPKLKNHLCPILDRSLAMFLQDLDQRGLLETTLVVVAGEFGRTPKIGQFSQNAMTQKTGRDHWPHAFTVLLAGGGVRGGQVYGSTTRDGGQVAEKPVTPADLAATILFHLGVDPAVEYDDHFQLVPRKASLGRPITDLG